MIQTTIKNRTAGQAREYDRTSPPVDVARRFGSLMSTMIELAELQFELLKDDFAVSKRRLIMPLVLSVFGVAAVLGFLPVALIALGYLLVELLELPFSAAMFIAAVTGAIVGAGLLLVAIKQFSRATATFEHSTSELSRNVQWIKATLRSEQAPLRSEK